MVLLGFILFISIAICFVDYNGFKLLSATTIIISISMLIIAIIAAALIILIDDFSSESPIHLLKL